MTSSSVLTSTCTAKSWNLTGIQLHTLQKRVPSLKLGQIMLIWKKEITMWTIHIKLKTELWYPSKINRKYNYSFKVFLSCLTVLNDLKKKKRPRHGLYSEYYYKNKDGKKHSRDLLKVLWHRKQKDQLIFLSNIFPPMVGPHSLLS
jgi:hypothetical protein